MLYCANCKQPLPTSAETEDERKKRRPVREHHGPFYYAGLALFWLLCLAALGVGIYKAVTWVDNYKLNRLYTRNAIRRAELLKG